ncbi:MAG: LytR C-terminal domain-containing protein [Candidatus Magasanikbacteria bacterium]
MEFSDIIALIKLGRELDTSNINTVVLDNSVDGYLKNGYSPDGAFILEPKSGNFDEIKQLISGVFEIAEVKKNDTPVQETEDKRLEDAAVEIQNGTWQAGLAARVKSILQKKEFIITDIGNTEERPQMQSGIYSVSGKNMGDVVDALKNELGIPAKEKTKAFTWATSTDILIILGEDYEE